MRWAWTRKRKQQNWKGRSVSGHAKNSMALLTGNEVHFKLYWVDCQLSKLLETIS